MGGSSDSEGRVEVSYNGEWGTVCDDAWDTNDASVVCRSLGFAGALEAVSSAVFGKAPEPSSLMTSIAPETNRVSLNARIEDLESITVAIQKMLEFVV